MPLLMAQGTIDNAVLLELTDLALLLRCACALPALVLLLAVVAAALMLHCGFLLPHWGLLGVVAPEARALHLIVNIAHCQVTCSCARLYSTVSTRRKTLKARRIVLAQVMQTSFCD
jgi:hypothetical protein